MLNLILPIDVPLGSGIGHYKGQIQTFSSAKANECDEFRMAIT
jgi:hypothetical protein